MSGGILKHKMVFLDARCFCLSATKGLVLEHVQNFKVLL